METWQTKIFLYIVVVLSAIIHEYAHGWAALRAGDSTAKYAGRLTLNPLAHLDMFGTVILPLVLLFTGGLFIGYAKPVPVNPYNFREQKRGMIFVSLAGVAVNFALGFIFAFIYVAASVKGLGSVAFQNLLGLVAYINIILALFNLIPIPPLDGSKLLAALTPQRYQIILARLQSYGSLVGIFLALLIAFFILAPLAQLVFGLFARLADLVF
ncbi:MAG: site-2 protease family protein [Candidatus Portnoybacteria bacterium CG10_big_fil_rev_8_21_14_0_10_44_7]|uniref:Site-2 protease family protein n=1 Tax=Candidatus Portnoybacteria bacterium CG10_big_fil_rev_8_21_14_0_10_44_7 TaxID=1974816 RepID=A0A2M8KIU7_9BACT|nr:MAG: site-2 protease family protein [Candidatus Portnoybacteria bacterium CG10_big_fil_rev_8_21_14_0_10_44_7]